MLAHSGSLSRYIYMQDTFAQAKSTQSNMMVGVQVSSLWDVKKAYRHYQEAGFVSV